jgi:hypothetical protein
MQPTPPLQPAANLSLNLPPPQPIANFSLQPPPFPHNTAHLSATLFHGESYGENPGFIRCSPIPIVLT